MKIAIPPPTSDKLKSIRAVERAMAVLKWPFVEDRYRSPVARTIHWLLAKHGMTCKTEDCKVYATFRDKQFSFHVVATHTELVKSREQPRMLGELLYVPIYSLSQFFEWFDANFYNTF